MGFFDLPSSLAALIDRSFALFAGDTLRVVLWSLVASALSMAAYRWLSNQTELARLKARIAAAKAEINAAPPEDYATAMATSRALLGLSLKHVGRALGPTLLAGLPVLFIVAFLANGFSYVAPQIGSMVPATIQFEDGRVENTVFTFPLDPVHNAVLAQSLIPGSAPDTPVAAIAKPSWTDSLFGNPAGYLNPDSAIRQISFEVKQKRLLPFGPGWLAGWEALFLVLMMVASLAIKFVFRIE